MSHPSRRVPLSSPYKGRKDESPCSTFSSLFRLYGAAFAVLFVGITPLAAKEIAIPKLDETPKLDGELHEAVWKQGLSLEDFVILDTDQSPAGKSTKVTIGYRAEGIYLAVECSDPDTARLPSAKEDGMAVLRNESIELLMAPPSGAGYYHLAFSIDGARFNSQGPKNPPIPLGNWRVATKRHAGSWTAEAFIPFSFLSLAGPVTSPWRLNVGRTTYQPEREYSLWNHESGFDQERLGFHQSRNFASATLLGAPQVSTSSAEQDVKLIAEDFEAYPVDRFPSIEWRPNTYGSGEVALNSEYFHRDAHPDRPDGVSVRLTRGSDHSGASIYKIFGSLPSGAKKVMLRAAAMSAVENSIFYPIVIGHWAAKLGFGKEGELFYSQKGANGNEEFVNVGRYEPLRWYQFETDVFPERQTYTLRIDGEMIAEDIPLARPIENWDRFLASTGGGEGGDELQVFYLDDIELQVAFSNTPATPPAVSDAEKKIAPASSATAVASVKGFGTRVDYGSFDSVLQNTFPVGLSLPIGFELMDRKWRWYGSREGGRIDALDGWIPHRDLILPIDATGDYEVSFLMEKVSRVGGVALPGVLIKTADGESFEKISPRFKETSIQWIPWKRIYLDGRALTLRQSKGNSAALYGFRLTPQGETQGPIIEVRGDAFRELLRSQNEIFEQTRPEDVARYLDAWLPKLKELHVKVIDLNGISTPETALTALDKAREYGMQLILNVETFFAPIRRSLEDLDPSQTENASKLVRQSFQPLVEKVKDHPAFLAYRIADEPFVEEAPTYRFVYQTLKEMDSLHPVISYQCRGSWEPDVVTKRGTDNMRKFIEGVGEEVLFNDLYPIRYPASEVAAHLAIYEKSLEDNHRQAGGRPLWILAQAIRYGNQLRDPTPDEIRVQAYLSLAYGATGLMYWNFNTPSSTLSGADGQLNASGRELGVVFKEINDLAPLFLKLERYRLDADFPEDFALQGFKDQEGQAYLVVVNKDVHARRKLDIGLASGIARKVEDVRGEKRLESKVRDEITTISLEIEPGDGRVLKLLK